MKAASKRLHIDMAGKHRRTDDEWKDNIYIEDDSNL